MSGVEALVGMGIGVTDLDGWVRAFGEVIGMDVRVAEGRAVARLDGLAERVVLTPAATDDVQWVRWAAPDAAALDAIAQRCAAADRPVRRGTPAEAAARRVVDVLFVTDPDGLTHEVVTGPLTVQDPLRVHHAGFVTGVDGMGHVVLAVADEAAAVGFFVDLLGFAVSDVVSFAAHTGRVGRVVFLRCSRRHHSVALVQAATGAQLRHLMVEYRELADMGRAYQRSQAAGTVSRHLGQHTNDRTVSHYVRLPSGQEVECGWGSRLVEVDEPVGQFDEASLWGHRRVG